MWSADLQMLKGESAGGGKRAVRSSKGTLHTVAAMGHCMTPVGAMRAVK